MMFTRLGLLGVIFVTGCLSRPLIDLSPSTNNQYVDQIKFTTVDKIDLLFMIDNSASMTDKQEILKEAVPVLLSRLVSPICIDAAGKPTGFNAEANGQCAPGKGRPEFEPIGDIHIGVVSSSLGAHGATVAGCGDVTEGNDRGRLVATMRDGAAAGTYESSGFLAWDSSGKANVPPGTNVPADLVGVFQDLIGKVGEHGCGYEASLESWYRFLIDPEPPASVIRVGNQTVRSSKRIVNADGSTGACTGCDDTLLAQRKAFLRPDSLLAIVMLSDENDCSIRDDSAGWIVGASARLYKGTSQCAANPNDRCCRYCDQKEPDGPPTGCQALADDAACKTPLDQVADSTNLRCYDQRRRFGFDMLYPTSRYVDALTKPTLPLQSTPGASVKNPLFDGAAPGQTVRDPSFVFLAGIVGVPWQDIADDASLADPKRLTYLTAAELSKQGRWRALVGDPNAAPPVLPTDPFMIETPDERVGTNPIVGVATSPSSSTNPRQNPINGHEQHLPTRADLQYACTFPLKTPKTCDKEEIAANSPLCEGERQTSAKAYPGTRELQVLQGLRDNAIVASICPKVIDAADPNRPSADPYYGYNPAVGAIVAQLKTKLAGKCLPRAIATDDQGQVLCRVIEAQARAEDCNCAGPGRGEVSADLARVVRTQIESSGSCTGAACNDWCMCEIEQVDSAHLKACQTGQGEVTPGYCYVDEQAKRGTDADGVRAIEEQLAQCPVNQRQRLSFADPAQKTPAPGAFTFIGCTGEAIARSPAGAR